MNEVWMKNQKFSDNYCNIVYSAQILLQAMTNNVRFTFSVSDTTQAVYK